MSFLLDGAELLKAVDLCIGTLSTYDGHQETLAMVEKARRLAKENNEFGIAALGGGWVGEEAIAIALYCAARFPNDFRAGVLASVSHGGDSDSTGCICGAILGTKLGVEAIPAPWIQSVESSRYLRELGERLAARADLAASGGS